MCICPTSYCSRRGLFAWFQDIGRHLLYACRSLSGTHGEGNNRPLASRSMKATVPSHEALATGQGGTGSNGLADSVSTRDGHPESSNGQAPKTITMPPREPMTAALTKDPDRPRETTRLKSPKNVFGVQSGKPCIRMAKVDNTGLAAELIGGREPTHRALPLQQAVIAVVVHRI